MRVAAAVDAKSTLPSPDDGRSDVSSVPPLASSTLVEGDDPDGIQIEFARYNLG
jgi:hypothetical protein